LTDNKAAHCSRIRV